MRFKGPKDSLGIEIRKIGNWAGAEYQYKTLERTIKLSLIATERAIANKIRANVRGHMRNQDLPWKAASKSKRGPKLMIETGTYYNSIKVTQAKLMITVGVSKDVIHPRSKQPLWRIARWQENGKGRIPKRPLWAPSIAEAGGKAGIAATLDEALLLALKNHQKVGRVKRGLK